MSVRYLNREVAAPLAGLSARHLLRLHDSDDPPPWTEEGYPAEKFGDWLKRRWLKDAGVAEDGEVYHYETERARLTKAQADKTELEAAELAGHLVRVDEVETEWGRMCGAVRARILSLPTKAAPRVRVAINDEEAAAILEVEAIEALDELSKDGLPPTTRERRDRAQAGAERSETATTAVGESVGGPVPPSQPGKRRRAGSVEN